MPKAAVIHYDAVSVGKVTLDDASFDECDPASPDIASPEKGYPVPSNEKQRLQSLWNLKILDTSSDERFDRIVHLATSHFGMPVCRVSFMDDERNWFKASFGVKVSEAPRAISICSHAIMSDDVLVAPNLTEDLRFSDNPQVTAGPEFRFYAGAPIVLKDGMRVGSLCIIDSTPHPEFSNEDAAYLEALAKIVVDELELHKQIVDRDQKLKDTSIKLDIANAAKARFLSTVSHELRTPLNAIVGFGQLIANGGKELDDTAKYCEFSEYICDASERLEQLVDRILLYSSADTEALKLCEDEIDVKQFVAKCIDKISSEAAGRKVSISLWKDADAPARFYVDEVLTGEAIFQLLQNAVEHTRPGTEVRVILRRDKSRGLSISIVDFGEDNVSIDFKKVCEAFSQNEEGYDRPRDGIGLGLPITKALVEMHDGTLRLNAGEGCGVCADMVFPASRNR